MAIASCSVHIISRGKGRSAVAAAAYRAGQELHNAYDGLAHNYTRKTGIIYSDILTPAGAPDWAYDRQRLWNIVEQTERRKDAQLAREVMIALPRELSTPQNIELAREYAQRFVEQGMIADLAIHDSRDGNPHAHILLTMRPLEGDSFGKKCREWNATEKLIEWRGQYADLTNRYLERYGHDQRIDARSYEAQGLDQMPTIHLGPHAYRMEQQGIPSDRGDINREIEKDNQRIREIVKDIAQLEEERQRLKSEEHSLIEQYERLKEEVQKTAEELGQHLTDKGRDTLLQQEKNIENALRQLQHPTQGQEPYTRNTPVDEPVPQRKPSFDELYEVPSRHSHPQPEPPQPQERADRPGHPPPLRRHREDRHISHPHQTEESRERHRASKEQPKKPHLKKGYDALYERPEERYTSKEEEKPPHHAPGRKTDRQADYNNLYSKPKRGTINRQQHEPDPDDPE